MRHVHVDEAAVARVADQILANNEKYLGEASSMGAQCRIQLAVAKAWYLAISAEMNRGTDPHDLMHAVPSVLANFFGSFASNFAVDEAARSDIVTMMHHHFVCAVNAMFNYPKKRNVGRVPVDKGGRA